MMCEQQRITPKSLLNTLLTVNILQLSSKLWVEELRG